MKEFLKEKKVYVMVIASIIFIIGGIWFHFNKKNDKILLTSETPDSGMYTEDFLIENEANEEGFQDSLDRQEKSEEIMVHITGEVKNPGVVIVEEGTRLIEAIEKLGGPTDEADLEAINLAMKVKDEEKIYIPKEGEVLKEETLGNSNNGQARQNQETNIININTATQEQLKTLPGIGDAISASIIEYRESNGGFKNIEEIKNVNRIGEKIFQDIKEKIGI